MEQYIYLALFRLLVDLACMSTNTILSFQRDNPLLASLCVPCHISERIGLLSCSLQNLLTAAAQEG